VDGPALLDELRRSGLGAGLAAVGATSADVLEPARSVLHHRKAQGLHGSMQFTYRNPDRSTEPSRVLAGARSLVVGAYAYLRAEPPPAPTPGPGPGGGPGAGSAAGQPPAPLEGRVARYAWRDHYAELATGLEAMADLLRHHGWRAEVVADDNALVDRAAAWRAGLGWYGKNANLLLPGAGSWFVLGAVITDAPLPASDAPVPDGCGPCTRCMEACPTEAIVAPGVVDARRCLAWLVQAPGDIPLQYREAVGDRLYGCDDCQEVCPPNRLGERRHPAPPAEGDSQAVVDLAWLLDADDDELLDRLGRWYIPRRDPAHLRRNALVVLGNCGDAADGWVVAAVERYRRHADPMLRAHATWAGRRLGLLTAPDPGEADPRLRAEWDHPVAARSGGPPRPPAG
jgi:epoxyqueuosine reductase